MWSITVTICETTSKRKTELKVSVRGPIGNKKTMLLWVRKNEMWKQVGQQNPPESRPKSFYSSFYRLVFRVSLNYKLNVLILARIELEYIEIIDVWRLARTFFLKVATRFRWIFLVVLIYFLVDLCVDLVDFMPDINKFFVFFSLHFINGLFYGCFSITR